MNKKIRIEGRTLQLTNLDEVLFPTDGITKGDLVNYYNQIAEVMLPHLQDRPLTLHRFPDGIATEGFYQQQASSHLPHWIEQVEVEKEGGRVSHVVCQNKATLVYLANQACITLHTWLSRKDRPHYPDLLIFDLDPPADDFAPVREVAFILKDFLSKLGLEPWVKTTGSRGLHLAVPLDRSAAFDEVHAFANDIAKTLSRREPGKLTAEPRKDRRGGRLYLDYVRNSYGQTAVVPYSVRARDGAPVATPLSWDELEDKSLNSRSYNMKNIFARLSHKVDPWKDIWQNPCSLKTAQDKLTQIKQVFKSTPLSL